MASRGKVGFPECGSADWRNLSISHYEYDDIASITAVVLGQRDAPLEAIILDVQKVLEDIPVPFPYRDSSTDGSNIGVRFVHVDGDVAIIQLF